MKTVYSEIFENETEMVIELKTALYNRLGDSSLLTDGIYYSLAEAMGEWERDCLNDFKEVSNEKYIGWEVNVSGNYDSTERVVKPYLPIWIMGAKVKNYKHAKNLFNKYLRFAEI